MANLGIQLSSNKKVKGLIYTYSFVYSRGGSRGGA